MATLLEVQADWIAAQRVRAWQAPLRARVALWANGQAIGSVVHDVMRDVIFGVGPKRDNSPGTQGSQIAALSLLTSRPNPHFTITPPEPGADGAWHVQGDVTLALNALADQMRQLHVGHVRHYWRGEQLAVTDAQGGRMGSVERGAVRPLGIATRAVHLVGSTPDGGTWVQQRSLAKANDPGFWDTVMGGMVSAHDTLQTALERETYEEAGLHLNQISQLSYGGCVILQRPTGEADDDGIGYVVEAIDWYHCTVPHGLQPENQDGEVAQFQLLNPDELLARLYANQFTLEAALVMAAALAP